MKTKKLSVVLATYNEAKNIDACLKAVDDIADEIIVVDGSSTDQTVVIARRYQAKIITTTNKPMFHINKQMAIDAAKKDWILQLDADEVVDHQLKTSIKKLLETDSHYNAFYLKRKNFFLGRFLSKGGQYPDPVIRLFKKGKASLPQKNVHEQMVVSGATGTIKGHLLHYTAPTFSRYLANANRYTSLTAQEFLTANIGLNPLTAIYYLLLKPIIVFLKLYFRHQGFRDGFPGFIFALFSSLHFTLAYMKYWELKKQ